MLTSVEEIKDNNKNIPIIGVRPAEEFFNDMHRIAKEGHPILTTIHAEYDEKSLSRFVDMFANVDERGDVN